MVLDRFGPVVLLKNFTNLHYQQHMGKYVFPYRFLSIEFVETIFAGLNEISFLVSSCPSLAPRRIELFSLSCLQFAFSQTQIS